MHTTPKEFKSYRERRALSKTNHNATTDAKGLFEIEQSLKGQIKTGRFSFDGNLINLPSSLSKEDNTQQFKNRMSTDMDQIQREQNSTTKIIQKYGSIHGGIIQVNEDDHSQIRLTNSQKDKIKVGSIGTGILNQKKNLQTKVPSQKEIGNIVTPRRPMKQALTKSVVQIKTDKTLVKKIVNKRQQNTFIKKVQSLEEQLVKLGFQKQTQAKQSLRMLLKLLKQN